MGDGGSAGDPKGNGQNPTSAARRRCCGSTSTRGRPSPEIVHMGLRNPWRFSFDAQDRRPLHRRRRPEPVGVRVRRRRRRRACGHNFGWNVVEGSHCFNGARPATRPGSPRRSPSTRTTRAARSPAASSYRGKALPELDGRYFYADYCTGLLRSFAVDADGRRRGGSRALGLEGRDRSRRRAVAGLLVRRRSRRRALHRRAHRHDLSARPQGLSREGRAAGVGDGRPLRHEAHRRRRLPSRSRSASSIATAGTRRLPSSPSRA